MSVIVKVPFLTNNYDITKNEKLTKDIDVLSDEYRYENIKPGTKIYRVSEISEYFFYKGMNNEDLMSWLAAANLDILLDQYIYGTRNFKAVAKVKNIIPVLGIVEIEIQDNTPEGKELMWILNNNKVFISCLYEQDKDGNIVISKLLLALGFINGHILFI